MVERASWRWAVAAAVLAALAALPALAGAVPVDDPEVPPTELLSRVRASGSVNWSGYAETRGTLDLPDIPALDSVPELVGGTTRLRAWWRGPREWRVDALDLAAETGSYRDAAGSWTWDSGERRATRLVGDLPVRLPRPEDLLAPTLGRRLANAGDVRVEPLEARRVAGRAAAGLQLRPRDPALTTVDRVELWAEPRTGLPLRVDVYADGAARPSVTAVLLDLDLSAPPAEVTAFVPPADAAIVTEPARDIVELAERFAPFVLPRRLAGLPRTDRVEALRPVGGIATYGDGFTALTVLPLPERLGNRALRRLGEVDGKARASTPLVNGLIGRVQGQVYLLVGTVPPELLDRGLAELAADPPPLRSDE